MKQKFRFTVNISNESIKYVYLEPNAFEYKVNVGDKLEVVINEAQIPEKFFDETTPFQIDVDKDAITIWFNVIPEDAFLNGKSVHFRTQ